MLINIKFPTAQGIRKLFSRKQSSSPSPSEGKKTSPSSGYAGGSNYGYGAYYAPFDGQNSLGEMGAPVQYAVDHGMLTIRSWQLYLESNNYKTILKKLKDTVVGPGLNLQCQPHFKYLNKKGIKMDPKAVEAYNTDVEEMWSICANSTMFDYADKDTLGELHARAYLNSIAAGDILVMLKPVNNVVKVRLVDGVHVQTPISFPMAMENKIGYEYVERINPANGNRVRWGIEIDATGKHIAFHVRVGMGLAYERVLARGPRSGSLMAYMLTDEEFRIDNLRGLPRMTAGMEMASQLSRYQSAMVSAAEELAKAPYFIKHDLNSSGEDPRLKDITKAFDVDRPSNDNSQLAYTKEDKLIAHTVSASTNRMVTNMTPGSELKAIDSKGSLHYEPFNKAVKEDQAALAGIPPEIVASKFDSNFSASRAAFLAEGMRLSREWAKQGNHFLQPIFNLQLDIWVQQFEITAPGYLEALQNKNQYVLNAYRRCSWEGQKLGHIDPLKEVNYWRAVLGSGSGHISIGTFEQAAKALGLGDSVANIIQYAREMGESDSLKIEHEDAQTADPDNEEEEIEDGDDPNAAPVKKKKAVPKKKKKTEKPKK